MFFLQVLDVEGMQWNHILTTKGVSIHSLNGSCVEGGGRVMRGVVTVRGGAKAVSRLLWDFSKRAIWDESCVSCKSVHKFDPVFGVVWCSEVQCGAAWCNVVQCGAVWCSVVQCGEVGFVALQCVALCCSVSHCVSV